ncbi:MAG: 2-amino-4-hydroxy-6-hydroxymethyldihydropteridine diphosphokinase [Acidobacteriota bacterium]|nr:2-amino-4-hydroxy-6-hydroxymethyldihydropteridine diphosphokinase [Acidobacteriota bacterium]
MTRAYLSLGSNVGDRLRNLSEGVRIVVGSDPHRVSRVYETEPVGGVDQADFWNLVVELDGPADPRELLARAHRAEAARSRIRQVRWGPRTLDVDVLWVEGVVSDDPTLTLPHPRLYERAFVLHPLRELAPDLVSDEQLAAGVGRVVALGTLESLT